MDARNKKRRNLLQNIAIVLLLSSAAALFAQTQLYNLHTETGYLSSFFSSSAPSPQNISGLSDLPMPTRVAVTGAYGRWANLSMTTGSEEFAQLGSLLMEALGSAGSLRPCTEADFQAALGAGGDYGSSVYYDFENALPLSLLAGLVGANWIGGDLLARRVLLAAEQDAVQLYLWDGESACFLCPTALPMAALRETVSVYPLGSAYFAFDQPENYSHVAPFSLFSDQLIPPAELGITSAISDVNALMTALSFNPHTNFRYSESSGADVVVEGDRTLRIRSDGEVSYQGSSGSLHISSPDETPTEAEIAVGVYQLLRDLLAQQGGAGLYLQSFQMDETAASLTFGYQFNGMPLRFADGGAAAEVTVEGAAVTRLTLRVRQCAAKEAAGLLLPLPQALSIARSYPGRELTLCYVDSGSAASAQWLAE